MAVIGIDLGTSNSAAAVLRGGRPVIIPGAEGISLGGKAFPSYAPHAYPDTRGAGVGEKPSGSGERGRVVDADYEESS